MGTYSLSHKVTNHSVLCCAGSSYLTVLCWISSSRRCVTYFSFQSPEVCIWGLLYSSQSLQASLPASLIGLLCLWKPQRGSPHWTHLVVCRADASERRGAVRRRRGDPRVYKRRSPLRAGAVRHSDPAEAEKSFS